MAENNSSLGYMALVKQANPTTPLTPTTFVPYFDQNLVTDPNIISDKPIFGNKYRTFATWQGHRTHKGTITAYGEPNTIGYWLDMLLTHTGVSGTGPYTHTYALAASPNPNSYTLDISLVSQVVRFWGVQASKMELAYQGDELQPKITVSALGSFYGAEVASVATNTITVTTTHDPNPTNGLVVGDLVAIKSPDGTRVNNTTISAITATTVTVAAAGTAAAGDMLVIRPATPSYTLLPVFVWPNNQFCFGATAAAALSATQTRLEPGSVVTITHDFKSDDGENRSGAFDPASLIRMVGDVQFKCKQFFDTPDQTKQWLSTSKNAMVNRQYASGTTYELRTTLNALTVAKLPTQTKYDEVIYQDEEFVSTYNQTDGQGGSVTLISGVATY